MLTVVLGAHFPMRSLNPTCTMDSVLPKRGGPWQDKEWANSPTTTIMIMMVMMIVTIVTMIIIIIITKIMIMIIMIVMRLIIMIMIISMMINL